MRRPDAYLGEHRARGPLVDESGARRALDDGRIAGAGLDVWEGEPTPADNPADAPAGNRHRAQYQPSPDRSTTGMVEAAAENVLRALRGSPSALLRNRRAGPAWRRRLATLAGDRG